jgi:hypothetical protein
MARRTLRTDYDLPRVHRDHNVAPRMADEQAREALRVGLDLQQTAVHLDPQHAREAADAVLRQHILHLAVLAFILEIAVGVVVIGAALDWWPT